ncbi:MAG TPA: molybdopterin-dependent oxidoreductase [Thermoanaerobaculia bacterium]|nr:molybdopterin-dependent oxidoreductase [Thermoanaerobaculia bacterium]HUM28668.1 molybdopterin-dependent oxidoreductase [Thermoanaerobaculia bacterium]HXK66724.1 molybdopterin-dependent oxidoreductase [Thermoanaerobaculia bacterium]
MTAEIETTCTRRCPDTCLMVARREGGRIMELTGDPKHPYTRGQLCKSQELYLENVLYHTDRILVPHRKGMDTWSTWQVASHNEIIDDIVSRVHSALETYGPRSILHIQSDTYPGISRHLNTLFFRSLGGTRRITPYHDCAAGLTGQHQDFGAVETSDPMDVLSSKLIILWGKNVAQSAIHFNMIIQQARKRGAKVLLIDPIVGPSIRYADAHYQVAPGGDSALALAMAGSILRNSLHDEKFCSGKLENFDTFRSAVLSLDMEELCKMADLSPTVVENLARLYATTRPAFIIAGRGMVRQPRGGQTIRLIDALSLITGQIGQPGSGVFFHRPETGLNLAFLESVEHPHEEVVSPAELPTMLEKSDPPIQVIFINHADPVQDWPGGIYFARALRNIPTVVVMDHFFTDTADSSTHFLPSATMLERMDIVMSPYHPGITLCEEVIPPRKSSRTEFTYYQAMARRLNLAHPVHPYGWYMNQLILPLRKHGITIDRLRQGMVLNPLTPKVAYADGIFRTPSSKAVLISKWNLSPLRERKFPLILLCPSLRKWQTRVTPPNQQEEPLLAIVHPDTLAKLKLEPGQHARVIGPDGEVDVVVQDDPEQRQDTVIVPFGKWIYLGGNINNAVPVTPTDIGKSISFHGTGVILR